MRMGLLTLHLYLAGCTSLKEKRRRLKPLIVRLHREFNVSVSEMEKLDTWQEAVIACAFISNDQGHTQRSLQQIPRWIEASWPDVTLISEHLELI
jgi:uncharacterized protein YlxP (DUF503 family)